MNDYIAVLAATQDELDSEQAEYDAPNAELDAYCNQNPGACGNLSTDELMPTSGPSVCEDALAGCVTERVTAGLGLLGALTTVGMLGGAAAGTVAGGGTLTVGAIVGGLFAVGVVAFASGYLVGSYLSCKAAQMASDDADFGAVYRHEPAYWTSR